MIFGAVYKSISLRMMLHLLQQPNKTDGYQVILADCIKNQSYAQRLEILLDKQMIVEQLDGTYHLTQKGRSIASKIHSLQQFFAIQESG